ncbi:MAG: error-prone DNA polymerase [Anderseniella sp.]|jgi:error-prone DNA polymerase|nr:error-prone DNA polymerase [Anderseniella sp.]
MSKYTELQVTTPFSFLRGASHAEELVAQAKHLGLSGLAVTDRNSLAGAVRMHAAAKEAGLKCIIGARLDVMAAAQGETREGLHLVSTPVPACSLLAWATNRAAYGRLTRLISLGQRRAGKGECLITLDDVAAFQHGLMFCVIPPPGWPDEGFETTLRAVLDRLDVKPHLAATIRHDGRDKARLNRLAGLERAHGTPMLATNDVHFHHPARKRLADVMACIREGVTIAEAGYLLAPHAEAHLKSPAEMARLFRDHPQAITRTQAVADACTFSLDELKYEYPDEPVPKGTSPQKHLEALTWAGAQERYPQGLPDKVRANLVRELALIGKLGYAPYFLTVHDIVNFARTRPEPILCQGRGSAANSAVCYCIGITAVDPAAIDLLFERFISEERKEPPDIDIDFEHERREEVIQYIYARYGRERAGLAATVITYRGRSAVREVGKVMGLSQDVTSALAGIVWGRMSEEMSDARLKEAGLDAADPLIAQVLDICDELAGFPRHLSQHVGGFVLTRGRLDETVPIGNAAMEDRTVIEWDKDDIDTLGILKVDVLALGMLTCIRKCFDLIEGWYGVRYCLATVPREDPAVYDMLCRADSVGVFQVESRAQMNMLPRLKPRCFYDLVIEVAIVRPGPIQGDMVHPYLRRRDGLEPEEYPAPAPEHGHKDELREVLGRTRGVPLFQEQAMKLAMVAADFTPGELNELRKAMATFRRRGTIGRLEQKMINRMVERGYERAFAERCFNQIKGFGEYGFPESHAASFAHLVYVSSWLKCHYPAVFCAAILNSQPMGFYAPAQLVRDAREHGVTVNAPDVNFSRWDCTLEGDPARPPQVRLGLRLVDGLKEADGRMTATLCPGLRAGTRSNAKAGPRHKSGEQVLHRWTSLPHLHRAGIPAPAIVRLAEADAFRSLGIDRRQALWQARALARAKPLPLFAHADAEDAGEDTPVALPEMALSEHVVNDYQTLKLSLKAHPMSFLRPRCEAMGVTDNEALKTLKDMRKVKVAGVVLVRQRPGSAKGVVFITLEDESGVCNLVIWPKVLEAFRATVMGARLMLVTGRVQRAGDIIHVVADRIDDCTHWLGELSDEAELKNPLARADEIARPNHDRRPPAARHPRNVRVIPKSRDFH